MFRTIFLVILLAIVGIVGYAYVQDPAYTYSRQVTIAGTPEQIFPYIVNSQKMNEWMPWQEIDPSVKMEYSGPAEGVGSKTAWTGTGEMGTGHSEITAVTPNESVVSALEMVEPFPMKQVATIKIAPADGKSLVTWSVSGENNMIARVMSVFLDFDKQVGTSFEKGLNTLKAMVETSS